MPFSFGTRNSLKSKGSASVMDSDKHAKSDSSSEESDRQEQVIKEDAGAGSKRSYECTYCKRGFTNAQALGGHMNIHRKDRAKAKQHQHTTNSSFSKATTNINEDHRQFMNSRYFAPISSEQGKYYVPGNLEAQRNYHMYFPSTVSGPNNHPQFYHGSEFSAPIIGSDFSSPNEDGIGSNLSLRIGSTHMENREEEIMRVDEENDEVDLELRLGPDP